MDEGGHAGIPDVVVLAVSIQTGGGAQGGVGGGGAGVTQSSGGGHQDSGSGSGEAHSRAQGDIDDGNDGNGGEGRADTHGDQQADQGDHGGSDDLVAAHDGNGSLDQSVNGVGGLHNVSVTAGDQHDDGDQAHDLNAALELLVDVLPLDGLADEHDQQADGGRQSQQADLGLNDHDDNDGQDGHIVSHGQLVGGNSVGLGGVNSQVLVLAGLAVGHEHGQQQTDQHAGAQHPVVLGDLTDGDGHAVGGHVVSDDAHEDGAEAEGDGDVGSLQTESQSAGGAAAVDLHLIHQAQQGGNQDGDESDVDGDQVLGEAGDEGNDQQHDLTLAAQDLGQLLSQNVSQAGGGDGSGEGAQQDVRQSSVGVVGEAAGQDAHGIDGADTADHGADHSGDDQGHQDVQLAQTQDTQQQNRNDYGISKQFHCENYPSF